MGNPSAPTSRDRAGGPYQVYLPDRLVERPIRLSADLGKRAATAERSVRSLASVPGGRGLEGLSRFLLRSEAIASSRIEGLRVSPQQVAIAEIAEGEGLQQRATTAAARLVANNITTLRRAATEVAEAGEVEVAGVEDLREALLPEDKIQGCREVQNWIGGGPYSPLGAQFVPPPPDLVRPLMMDLCDFTTGALSGPLVQAALVHAQFETIHPFTDGNGRVGRALIHTVLTRRALTKVAVLPVSLVLLTRAEDYVAGLTAYRYSGEPSGEAAAAGTAQWVGLFLEAVEIAVDKSKEFVARLEELRESWATALYELRVSRNLRPEPRSDAATSRLLDALPEVPLLTARTAEKMLGTSYNSARAALDELASAKILRPKALDRGTTGYLADDIFELLVLTERALASTQWDTQDAKPNRPTPALPQD